MIRLLVLIAIIIGGVIAIGLVIRDFRTDKNDLGTLEKKVDYIAGLIAERAIYSGNVLSAVEYPRALTPEEIKEASNSGETLERFSYLIIVIPPWIEEEEEHLATINFEGTYKVIFRKDKKNLAVHFVEVKEPPNHEEVLESISLSLVNNLEYGELAYTTDRLIGKYKITLRREHSPDWDWEDPHMVESLSFNMVKVKEPPCFTVPQGWDGVIHIPDDVVLKLNPYTKKF